MLHNRDYTKYGIFRYQLKLHSEKDIMQKLIKMHTKRFNFFYIGWKRVCVWGNLTVSKLFTKQSIN